MNELPLHPEKRLPSPSKVMTRKQSKKLVNLGKRKRSSDIKEGSSSLSSLSSSLEAITSDKSRKSDEPEKRKGLSDAGNSRDIIESQALRTIASGEAIAIQDLRKKLKNVCIEVEMERLYMLLELPDQAFEVAMLSDIPPRQQQYINLRSNARQQVREAIRSCEVESKQLDITFNRENSHDIDLPMGHLMIRCGGTDLMMNPKRLLDFKSAKLNEDIINAWIAKNRSEHWEVYLSESHWKLHPLQPMSHLRYIVMPTFDKSRSHWFATVIRIGLPGEKSIVVVCDSVQRKRLLLDDRVSSVYDKIFETLGRPKEDYRVTKAEGLAQQSNGVDCGVWTLIMIKQCMSDPKAYFERISGETFHVEQLKEGSKYEVMAFRSQIFRYIIPKIIKALISREDTLVKIDREAEEDLRRIRDKKDQETLRIARESQQQENEVCSNLRQSLTEILGRSFKETDGLEED